MGCARERMVVGVMKAEQEGPYPFAQLPRVALLAELHSLVAQVLCSHRHPLHHVLVQSRSCKTQWLRVGVKEPGRHYWGWAEVRRPQQACYQMRTCLAKSGGPSSVQRR
jgi:hypothetical protein